VTLESKSKLLDISQPAGCTVKKFSQRKVYFEKLDDDLKKDINIYFKTRNMETPKFYYQKCAEYPGKVAVMG